jgi:sn-glycerol 3-phosphate transport system substrate-binding protein
MTRRHSLPTGRAIVVLAVAAGLALSAAACGSDKSILDAGREPIDTTPQTDPETGETIAPTIPPTTAPPLADFPPCPANGLDGRSPSDDPVEITFWYALGGENKGALEDLTKEFNESQNAVRVRLENQSGYTEMVEKFRQSGQGARPDTIMLPEYIVQEMVDSDSAVPVEACMEASNFDTSPYIERTLDAYATAGIQWGMPFNVSNPVLYYNKKYFAEAGLDPNKPPKTLEQLHRYSEKLVSSGAAGAGIGLESGTDSGGGWFIEQWLAKDLQLFANNNNGRSAPATRVLYDNDRAIGFFEELQSMVEDGSAVYLGDNTATGFDQMLAMGDPQKPTAMGIATSAALSTVLAVLGGGLIPGVTGDDIGVGPMPGPNRFKGTLVGGAALYIMSDRPDEVIAGVWKYVQFLTGAGVQSRWAARTGYVPVREDALDVEPLKSLYKKDPRFKVAYDQLVAPSDNPATDGPVVGPLKEIRSDNANATAAILNGSDVAEELAAAATRANTRIRDYAEEHQ